MYTIGYIVWGIDLNKSNCLEDIDIIAGAEWAKSHHSGSGQSPLYIGELLSRFDCIDSTQISPSLIGFSPSSKDEANLKKQIDALLVEPDLSDEFKTWLKSQSSCVFITWGTS